MDTVNVVSPRNVEAITIQMFFTQLDDIKQECAASALEFTNDLLEAWSDYSKLATLPASKALQAEHNAKLATLMCTANTMANMLKPATRMRLFNQHFENSTCVAS